MHLPTTSFASARLSGSARPRVLKTALACGLLSRGLAVSAQAADAAYFVNVKHQTLAITGNFPVLLGSGRRGKCLGE